MEHITHALTQHGYVCRVFQQYKSITLACEKGFFMNKHMSVVPHCVATYTNCMRTQTFLQGFVAIVLAV